MNHPNTQINPLDNILLTQSTTQCLSLHGLERATLLDRSLHRGTMTSLVFSYCPKPQRTATERRPGTKPVYSTKRRSRNPQLNDKTGTTTQFVHIPQKGRDLPPYWGPLGGWKTIGARTTLELETYAIGDDLTRRRVTKWQRVVTPVLVCV
ncbi:unnamed protein product [Ectocarpus sp. 12 AP-2014]